MEYATRGAVQDAAYGVLRYRGTLMEILRQLVAKPLSDMHTQALLLVCLYQLIYTKVAPYAVVNNGVDASPRKFKNLVNAVLRNFQRRQQSLIVSGKASVEGRYNHQEWWVEKLRKEFPGQWEAMLAANQMHPPLTVRVNRRKATMEKMLAEFYAADLQCLQTGPTAIKLDHPVPVSEIPGFFEGRVSVQDAGAQWAAVLMDVKDGMRVLDACAAPGGKTGHLLESADVGLLALDVDEGRLERVGQNLDRLGLQAELRVGDAAHPQTWWNGRPFDRILADVPCTASGVVRRHPDIKWLRRPQDIASFVRKQAEIVDALWQTLAPGGKLLYATCSVFADENEKQIKAFLARHQDSRRLELPEELNEGQLIPDEFHDGFFYALVGKS
jgi:16S rRNA (cytosine967-C5)-methyltransferase